MSWLSTLTGSESAKAANAAAQDTYLKQQNAINSLLAYGNQLPGQYKEIASAYQPYTQAGTSALNQLMAGLGLSGGPEGQAAFTSAYQNLPGYQSGLATGQQAAMRALNAGGGGLNSGRALKSLYRYGSDYENQRVGDYLGRLGGLTSTGLNATQGQTGLEARGIDANTGIHNTAFGGQMNSARTIGEGLVAAQQAKNEGIGNLVKTGASLLGSAIGGFGGLGGLGSLGSTIGSYFPTSTGSYGGTSYPIFGSAKGNAWFS